MITNIVNALVIMVLIVVGMTFLLNKFSIIDYLKGDKKNMNRKMIAGKIMKLIGCYKNSKN